MTDMPGRWDWELDLSLPHLHKRMLKRNFSETDPRTMLEAPTKYDRDHEPDRYAIQAIHEGELWHVVVEPQLEDEVLVVITAYKPG